MNDPRDVFQDEALSILYQTTRGIEPPVWLDERILQAAQTAVQPPAPASVISHSRQRRNRFWAMPVALAATLVLAVGVVHLVRETGERASPMAMKAPLPAPPATKTDAASVRLESMAKGQVLPAAPPASTAPKPSTTMSAARRRSDSLQEMPTAAQDETAVQLLKAKRSPEKWLAEIAEWRRQGRITEAEASLAEFRRRYPDYPQGDR